MIKYYWEHLWNKQLYVILKDGAKQGEYMDSLLLPTPRVPLSRFVVHI